MINNTKQGLGKEMSKAKKNVEIKWASKRNEKCCDNETSILSHTQKEFEPYRTTEQPTHTRTHIHTP